MDKDNYVENMQSELETMQENFENEETEQARASIRRMQALTKKLQNNPEDDT